MHSLLHLYKFYFLFLFKKKKIKLKKGIDEFNKKSIHKRSTTRTTNALSSNQTQQQRIRRSVKYNYPYVIDRKIYLELLVVVDKKMEEFYGNGLENHVLTLLFLVSDEEFFLLVPKKFFIFICPFKKGNSNVSA